MDMTALLKKLSCVMAPSGREHAMAEAITEEIGVFCDELAPDKIGNLIARVSPARAAEKRLMFVSHMDECGFMIRNIDADGRLRVSLLGNFDSRVLSGRRVSFLSGARGIAASKPIHAQSGDERAKPTPADKLYIELGTGDRAATEEKVHIGDFGTFEPKFTPLANGFYAGKALGGRAACAALCALVREAAEMKKAGTLRADCYFVFTVKREIARATAAAETAAFAIRPDMAVVLDAVPAADFGGAEIPAAGAKCGAGAVIAPADMKTIYDRELFARAVALCGERGVTYQHPGTASGAGGDAGTIHRTAAGARSLSIGIPTRNLHSGAEIVKMDDLDAVVSLAGALLEIL